MIPVKMARCGKRSHSVLSDRFSCALFPSVYLFSFRCAKIMISTMPDRKPFLFLVSRFTGA